MSKIITRWGPFFRGASFAEYSIDQDGVKGTIDNRKFVTTSNAYGRTELQFDDGGDPPELHVPPGLPSLLPGFFGHVAHALNSCLASNVSQAIRSDTAQSILTFDRIQDTGHFSFPFNEAPCVACRVAVFVVEAIAVAACDFSGIFTFGLSVIECNAGALAAAALGLDLCYHSGACCPQICGPEQVLLSTCCEGQETCLNRAVGLCCSEN